MPIAVHEMNGGPVSISPTTPTKVTKAAFFRARSPPVLDRQHQQQQQNQHAGDMNDLAARFDLSTRLGAPVAEPMYNNRSLLVQDEREAGGRPSMATDRALSGHTPPLDSSSMSTSTGETSRYHPTSPPVMVAGIHEDTSSVNEHDHDNDDYEGYDQGGKGGSSESASMGIAAGSDEMLMTLLAGQAAVDCETLPIGGWEEVESWKKELSLLSNRLSSLVERHQREVKILAAARTLQKLNNSNKRMSKQTMESLEQSEKRAEAAEKEVLVLRDREAALRQRLMEHWSGVMAWEVRRLERVATEAQARFNRQSRQILASRDRESALSSRLSELETEFGKRAERVAELEEMVVEMGRRERAIEEELKDLDRLKEDLDRERSERKRWDVKSRDMERDKQTWEAEKRRFEDERRAWEDERAGWDEERQDIVQAPRMSDRDRANMDNIRAGLGGLLRRKGGMVAEDEVESALSEVKSLLERRENEVVSLKEEMREVNMGLEEELKRTTSDRDGWKSKHEQVDTARRDEVTQLERQLRNHADTISDLNLRNESLSTSLNAAQTHVSHLSATSASTAALQSKVDALTSELESIANSFTEVWRLLPSPARRIRAELIDARTGQPNSSVASPNHALDLAALQQLYSPASATGDEKFGGIEEMIKRIRGMVDDGRLLVDRVVRLGQERDLHKGNALKAKRLAEESTRGLETYQQQVRVLEDRLATTGNSESRFLEELNSLRTQLDTQASAKRALESQLAEAKHAVNRLTEANADHSTRALTLADEAETEMVALKKRLENEIENLQSRVAEAEEEAEEARTRGQSQRIQLLDEMNSLQMEVGDLRKQLRAAQRGGMTK
ncbi:Up-regulated during septation-domain-containing protein [Naematelia encephala]|uniref:Up-regulated during septation-domain-containing protein n=1 Tax=Naematelia encephala TaxID=71784 RepID=A0A1Y2AQ79_9TREE|nr:Up-regulated during septation-domain-containing protein [Naematelia encephala]